MFYMNGFVIVDLIREFTREEFSQAYYMSISQYGLLHILVTDADSKFKHIFRKMVNILKIPIMPDLSNFGKMDGWSGFDG